MSPEVLQWLSAYGPWGLVSFLALFGTPKVMEFLRNWRQQTAEIEQAKREAESRERERRDLRNEAVIDRNSDQWERNHTVLVEIREMVRAVIRMVGSDESSGRDNRPD